MRRAIVEFNLPLFGISNVTLKDSHAMIKGARGEYTVHLGSGVIHQAGGALSLIHIWCAPADTGRRCAAP